MGNFRRGGDFNRGHNDRGFGGFKRGGFGGGNRGGSWSDRGDREMFDAVCDSCGKSCQVPFRPTQGKPVYCSACFEQVGGADRGGSERRDDRGSRRDSRPAHQNPDQYKAQFEAINNKLDKLISLLTPPTERQQVKEAKPKAVEVKTEETAKEAKKVKAIKKTTKKASVKEG